METCSIGKMFEILSHKIVKLLKLNIIKICMKYRTIIIIITAVKIIIIISILITIMRESLKWIIKWK